jgi:hypothetical protein
MKCGASVTVMHFFKKLINGRIMSKNKITDQQLVALEKILDYMWKDEMKHWFEYDMPEEHTFSCLKELGKLVPNFSGHEYLIECLDKIKQEAVD